MTLRDLFMQAHWYSQKGAFIIETKSIQCIYIEARYVQKTEGRKNNEVCLSFDGKKYYAGTHLGISVVDAETKSVLAKKKIDYGVQNITEIAPNVIVVSTWNGVKVLEIVD